LGLLVAVVLITLGHATSAPAITADEFHLRSGADLLALCATPAADPLHVAAIHMCHGFGAGAYQAIMAMTRHEKLTPLICPPTPPPTRNSAVAMFVEWARRNPQHLHEPPAETLGRFLVTTFPCR
jgi:hypothetical protein